MVELHLWAEVKFHWNCLATSLNVCLFFFTVSDAFNLFIVELLGFYFFFVNLCKWVGNLSFHFFILKRSRKLLTKIWGHEEVPQSFPMNYFAILKNIKCNIKYILIIIVRNWLITLRNGDRSQAKVLKIKIILTEIDMNKYFSNYSRLSMQKLLVLCYKNLIYFSIFFSFSFHYCLKNSLFSFKKYWHHLWKIICRTEGQSKRKVIGANAQLNWTN